MSYNPNEHLNSDLGAEYALKAMEHYERRTGKECSGQKALILCSFFVGKPSTYRLPDDPYGDLQ